MTALTPAAIEALRKKLPGMLEAAAICGDLLSGMMEDAEANQFEAEVISALRDLLLEMHDFFAKVCGLDVNELDTTSSHG